MDSHSSLILQKQDEDDYKFRCMKHDKPAFFCLNQYCKEPRLLCVMCQNEGQHNHQKDFRYFSELVENLSERKKQFISILEQLLQFTQTVNSFKDNLQFKYDLSKDELLLMNNIQLNSFIDHMLNNQEQANYLLKSLKSSFSLVCNIISENCEILQLEQSSYNWAKLKQNYQDSINFKRSQDLQIDMISQNLKNREMPNNQKANNQSKTIESCEQIERKPIHTQNQQDQINNKMKLLLVDQNFSFKQKNQDQNSIARKFDLDSHQQKVLNLKQEDIYKNCHNYPIALIIGGYGAGKTTVMKILFQGILDKFEDFKLYPQKIDNSLIYNFVDTREFDFDSDFDQREDQIKHYQQIFYDYPNKVRSILVVINFQSIDLMKKNLLQVYKFFKIHSQLITIIILDMQMNNDRNFNLEALKQNFSNFKAQNIIFIKQSSQRDDLINQLKQKSLNKLELNYKFDVTDTIFEKEKLFEINYRFKIQQNE